MYIIAYIYNINKYTIIKKIYSKTRFMLRWAIMLVLRTIDFPLVSGRSQRGADTKQLSELAADMSLL